MADVELVIKIPEETYQKIKEVNMILGRGRSSNRIDSILFDAVSTGTPLPKNHGDLKDMDDIYKALEGWSDDTGWIVDAIDCQAETIIEADAEE